MLTPVIQPTGVTSETSPHVMSSELELRLVDLAGPTTVWSSSFPPGSAAFEVDEEWVGVLTAEGRIVFLDLNTGQTVQESIVEVPPGLAHIATAVTERTIYVSLSTQVTEQRLVNALSSQPGWRRVFVNGPVHAFDRLSGALQWSRKIENRTLPLDQVRDVPLLLCVDAWNGPDASSDPNASAPQKTGGLFPRPKAVEQTRNRYWCLDARTGKVVLETSFDSHNTPQYTIERSLTDSWVELRLGMNQLDHRFHYLPAQAQGNPPL